MEPVSHKRRVRADGERSRHTILDMAARLATIEGIDGLTIGRLADETGMSKSGLYAHWGSKEQLQLATVAFAKEIFDDDVVNPALEAAEGVPRVEALCERFLSHVERRVFPGGCFFLSASAELDTRPGRVHDQIAQVQGEWMERMAAEVTKARRAGELARRTDIQQLTFELNALLAHANMVFLLFGRPDVFDLARRGIRDRLKAARG